MNGIVVNIIPGEKICELGGGSDPLFCRLRAPPGSAWHNVDIRPLPCVDIVADLESHLPIEDRTYDFIFSKYSIEHIGWRNVKSHISEMYRILNPGGRVLVITANLYEQCKKIASSSEWDENFSGMVFGGQDFGENAHKVGFSPEYISKLFADAGFVDIHVVPLPECITDMILQARKGVA